MEKAPHTLRRFLLLGGENYYARGGMHDFISSHDTLDDAVRSAHAAEDAPKFSDQIDWWHVWDCQKNCVAACGKSCAYGVSEPQPELPAPPEAP